MDEFITTTGNGAVSTEPDAIRVSVAVEASAPTVAEALATVAEAAGRRRWLVGTVSRTGSPAKVSGCTPPTTTAAALMDLRPRTR